MKMSYSYGAVGCIIPVSNYCGVYLNSVAATRDTSDQDNAVAAQPPVTAVQSLRLNCAIGMGY